ncbi:MAG: hypothetical protein AB8I08_39725, partial [Sandaracinaceae bacterium]
LARGAWGEAWPLIDRVSWSRRHLHRRLRRAAASRIARRMRSAATIDVATVHALERLWDGWNAIVFDAIAARIEAGPERGPAAVALVELLVFGSVSSEQEGQRATLLAAIDARCVDARGELGRACERARSRLAPRGCVVPSFRRGVAVSPVSAVRPATRGARSRPRRSAPCTALTREWEALEERGPAPETR